MKKNNMMHSAAAGHFPSRSAARPVAVLLAAALLLGGCAGSGKANYDYEDIEESADAAAHKDTGENADAAAAPKGVDESADAAAAPKGVDSLTPANDFYGYVNARALMKRSIPATAVSSSGLDDLNDLVEERIDGIINDIAESDLAYAPGSNEQLIIRLDSGKLVG